MFFEIALQESNTHMAMGLFRIHLKELLSEDTVHRMVTFLHQHIFSHLLYGEIAPFSVLCERLGEFFGEDATVQLDANLEWYGPVFLEECLTHETYLPCLQLHVHLQENEPSLYRVIDCSEQDGPWVAMYFRQYGMLSV
jgi:hypothetical protein